MCRFASAESSILAEPSAKIEARRPQVFETAEVGTGVLLTSTPKGFIVQRVPQLRRMGVSATAFRYEYACSQRLTATKLGWIRDR